MSRLAGPSKLVPGRTACGTTNVSMASVCREARECFTLKFVHFKSRDYKAYVGKKAGRRSRRIDAEC